jgi:hypothetical protein
MGARGSCRYEPNSFAAKDSDYEVDVANRKSPTETIAVQENDGVCHAIDTDSDGMQNTPPPPESVAVANFNTNDHHKNFVSISTISFVAINYSLRLEEKVSVFICPSMFCFFA